MHVRVINTYLDLKKSILFNDSQTSQIQVKKVIKKWSKSFISKFLCNNIILKYELCHYY